MLYLQSAKLTIDNTKELYLKSVTNPNGLAFDLYCDGCTPAEATDEISFNK